MRRAFLSIAVFGAAGAALFVLACRGARLAGRFEYARARVLRGVRLAGAALGAGLGAVCALRFSAPGAATALLYLAVLWAAALDDAAAGEIPDLWHAALLAAGAAACFTLPGPAWWERALGLAAGVPLLVLSLCVEGAFGGGDIKLASACGLLLGWKLALLGLFIAVAAGGFYGGWLLLSHRAGPRSRFAFGPFLYAGAAAACLFGPALLGWWRGLFLL